MRFKKINAWLHLWLGLFSGIIVVIVSITGCIYVFENEIKSLYEPWRFVKIEDKAFVKPSALVSSALPYLKGETPNSIVYHPKGEAAQVNLSNRKAGTFTNVYINPYNSEILNVKTGTRGKGKSEFDFFRFILNGHRALWLPYSIGRPIVGVAILTFVVLLISGIVLWWPKKLNKSNINKSFKINWKAKFKRVNYDMHNVLGFYSMFILLIISLTGLVWSFQWVSKSLYWATTGGKSIPEFRQPLSDTTKTGAFEIAYIDKAWTNLNQQPNEGMFISVPTKPKDALGITLYLRANTFYKTDVYYFDQKSLKPLKGSGPFSGKYEQASIGDKLRRMNYDIHIGAILGIPGKIIAFLISLISASLPITGFLIWWGKKQKSKKKAKVDDFQFIAGETIKNIPSFRPRKVAFNKTQIN